MRRWRAMTAAVVMVCAAGAAQAQDAVPTRQAPPGGAGFIGGAGLSPQSGAGYGVAVSVKEIRALHASTALARTAAEKLRPQLIRCAAKEPKLTRAGTTATYTLTLGRRGEVVIVRGGPALKSASLNSCLYKTLKAARMGYPDGEGVATVKLTLALKRTSGLGSGREHEGATSHAPRLMMGPISSEGGLNRTLTRRVVRSHSAKLRACYAQSLRRNRELRGDLRISFNVLPKGTVTRLKWLPETIEEGRLRLCAAKVFSRMTFPKTNTPTRVEAIVRLGTQ